MSSNQLKYNVGDMVKVVSYQNEHQWEKDYGINIGDVVEIVSVNHHDYCVVSKTGKIVFVVEDTLELVSNLVSKEEEMQGQTPYQEKGYTENSLFKFVGDDGQFELGEVIKLHSDDGDDTPDFKSVTRDRCRYCTMDLEVEYMGEDGCEDMLPHYVEQVKQSTETEQGVKYDSGKLEYSLIPKGVLTPIIRVLQQGCQKYSKDNWQHVNTPKERYYNALQRHINQWWEGEKYDVETGENHLAHAACCLMFLLWFDNKDEQGLQDSKDMWQALTKVKE